MLLYFIIIKHTSLRWEKSSCLNSKSSLKLTECAKTITFLLINNGVLPQSLMVYFGTECIVHIFLHIFQCMVILILFYSWQTAIIFSPNPWASQTLNYPTHIFSVPTPGINNERSLKTYKIKEYLVQLHDYRATSICRNNLHVNAKCINRPKC